MPTVTLRGSQTSEIVIERGVFPDAGGRIAAHAGGRRVLVVTDTNVAPLYADALTRSLRAQGMEAFLHVLPAGEEYKTLDTVAGIYGAMTEACLTRADSAVALGGGVVGDMTGFAAATYLRGIGLTQIPTTLLAQVDSSVGGKCGVDLPQGKNLVGAFYQPPLVLIDPDLTESLPESVFCDGMAEVIKYGCIRDPEILTLCRGPHDRTELPELIRRSVRIKRGVVEADEREAGERMHLNFGHTFGHAIEVCGRYTAFTHGQAVAAGMALALRVGERLKITEPGTAEAVGCVLARYGLPLSAPYEADALTEAMRRDKKMRGGRISFIFLRRPGEVRVEKMAPEEITEPLRAVLEERRG